MELILSIYWNTKADIILLIRDTKGNVECLKIGGVYINNFSQELFEEINKNLKIKKYSIKFLHYLYLKIKDGQIVDLKELHEFAISNVWNNLLNLATDYYCEKHGDILNPEGDWS